MFRHVKDMVKSAVGVFPMAAELNEKQMEALYAPYENQTDEEILMDIRDNNDKRAVASFVRTNSLPSVRLQSSALRGRLLRRSRRRHGKSIFRSIPIYR